MDFGLWPWCSPWGARWMGVAVSHLVRSACSHSFPVVLEILAVWDSGKDRLLLCNVLVLSAGIYATLKNRYSKVLAAPPGAFIFVSSGDISRDQLLLGGGSAPSVEICTESGWVAVPTMASQDSLFYAAASFFAGAIFIIGGMRRQGPIKDVCKFDLSLGGVWQQACHLLTPRSGAAAITAQRCLFVIGGHDGRGPVNTGEMIERSDGDWQSLPKLNTARHLHQVEVLGGRVIVMGGIGSGGYLKTTELLIGDSWSFAAPLLHERCCFGSAVWRGGVVVLGGDDGWNRLDSVELLTDADGTWRSCGVLSWGRSGCAALVLENRLLVLGGYDGLQSRDSVEIYDFDNLHSVAHCTHSEMSSFHDGHRIAQNPVQWHSLNTPRNCLKVTVAYNHAKTYMDPEVGDLHEAGFKTSAEFRAPALEFCGPLI